MEDGEKVPRPSTEEPAGGKIIVRAPASVHAGLRRLAEREGGSLNEMAVVIIAQSVAVQNATKQERKPLRPRKSKKINPSMKLRKPEIL